MCSRSKEQAHAGVHTYIEYMYSIQSNSGCVCRESLMLCLLHDVEDLQ